MLLERGTAMSPNEWQLLPSRVLASSSCLIWLVLCVTFVERSHSPGGRRGKLQKRLEFKYREMFFCVECMEQIPPKPHKYVRRSGAEVGSRLCWGLRGRGGAGGSEDKRFIHSKASQIES